MVTPFVKKQQDLKRRARLGRMRHQERGEGPYIKDPVCGICKQLLRQHLGVKKLCPWPADQPKPAP